MNEDVLVTDLNTCKYVKQSLIKYNNNNNRCYNEKKLKQSHSEKKY